MERENTFLIPRTDQHQFSSLSFDHVSVTTVWAWPLIAAVVTVDWTKAKGTFLKHAPSSISYQNACINV